MGSSKPDGDKPVSPDQPEARTRGRCPICGAPTEAGIRPFCSRRCADVDLSRWLRGAYAVAGRADTDEDGDDTAAASGTVRGGSDELRDEDE